jgi:Metallo-peptidase family M12B Reprolysin-like/Carboxypeptidase regulatory-like domain
MDKIAKFLVAFAAAVLIVVGIWGTQVSSQSVGKFGGNELWQDFNEKWHVSFDKRQIIPDSYRAVTLNKSLLEKLLNSSSNESEKSVLQSDDVISLPLPDGKFSRFRFVESSIMEADLQAKFPEIKTFNGQGIDEPSAIVRFDYTPKGFHAIILSQGDSVYIDPYSQNDTDNYISYYKSNFQKEDKSFSCLVANDVPNALEKKHLHDKQFPLENLVNNAGTLRNYRLAMAATGEYTAFHGGTVAGALAAITTTVNRVNAVYERDLSVRLLLIGNTNLIIYTNAATDPYANTSSDLTANQNNITTVIGTANFDVGHLVGTGGGGVATLNSPCSATSKARGLTGSPAPVGDPFDIDYVAHELGHQFGGNHTFNGGTGNCSGGNRSGANAYEPGSGTTIQAYAGICGTQDLQKNSDDYFHIRSLEEMVAFSTGTACDVEAANSNSAPVVTAAAACTVPQDTPFELTGSATDANGDTMTYVWEEYDLGAQTTGIPNTDSAGAKPIFRTYNPISTPFRSFPSLPFILNNANVPPSTFTGTNSVGTLCASGTCLTGELMPTINRTMNFQLTARDNRAGGGGVRSANTAVTVVETSGATTFGPFAVTSPNTAVTYGGGTSQTVTWNAANTTIAPVSCANVDIMASTNGGTTFTTLLAATPNDGTEAVTMPILGTTTARIKVKCSTSCFFDISNTNFTILAPTAAESSIAGRVTTSTGRGIRNAIIKVSGGNLNGTRYVRTNPFGYYRINGLESGQTYIVSVGSKQYSFVNPTRVITLNEDLTGEDFVSND